MGLSRGSFALLFSHIFFLPLVLILVVFGRCAAAQELTDPVVNKRLYAVPVPIDTATPIDRPDCSELDLGALGPPPSGPDTSLFSNGLSAPEDGNDSEAQFLANMAEMSTDGSSAGVSKTDEIGLPMPVFSDLATGRGEPSFLDKIKLCEQIEQGATKACKATVDLVNRIGKDYGDEINRRIGQLQSGLEELQKWLARAQLAISIANWCGADVTSISDEIAKIQEKIKKAQDEITKLQNDRDKYFREKLSQGCDVLCGSKFDRKSIVGRIAYNGCMAQCQVRDCDSVGRLAGLGCRLKLQPMLQDYVSAAD